MTALIVGHDDAFAAQLYIRLAHLGVDCPSPLAHSLGEAQQALLTQSPPPTLVLLMYSGKQEATCEFLRQIRSRTSAMLVVLGKGLESQQIVQLIRAGASDYVEQGEHLELELSQVVERVREQISEKRTGKTFGIVAASGGCGCSSLACNLAVALATRKCPVGLIDLHLDGGDLATLLNLSPPHSILDLCDHGDRLDRVMFQKAMMDHGSGVKLLASPPLLHGRSIQGFQGLERMLTMSSELFDYTVLDLEDAFHDEQLRALQACNLVLVLMRLDFPCLLRTRQLLRHVRDQNVDPGRIRLIANRIGHSQEVPQRKVTEALGHPLFQSLPDDFEAMIAAVNLGSPVVLEAPKSRLAKSLCKLADAVAV